MSPARRGSDPRHDRDASPEPRPLRGDRQDAFVLEDLDHVADLDVVELLEADAALGSGFDLADVVLEAPQRADLTLVGDDVVADEARLRVARARNAPFGDHA